MFSNGNISFRPKFQESAKRVLPYKGLRPPSLIDIRVLQGGNSTITRSTYFVNADREGVKKGTPAFLIAYQNCLKRSKTHNILLF